MPHTMGIPGSGRPPPPGANTSASAAGPTRVTHRESDLQGAGPTPGRHASTGMRGMHPMFSPTEPEALPNSGARLTPRSLRDCSVAGPMLCSFGRGR